MAGAQNVDRSEALITGDELARMARPEPCEIDGRIVPIPAIRGGHRGDDRHAEVTVSLEQAFQAIAQLQEFPRRRNTNGLIRLSIETDNLGDKLRMIARTSE